MTASAIASLTALTIGARQFVVQEAFEMIRSSAFSPARRMSTSTVSASPIATPISGWGVAFRPGLPGSKKAIRSSIWVQGQAMTVL